MTSVVVAFHLLTFSLDAGGLLAQEASLRRSILPTVEAGASLRLVGPLEASVGYGIAGGREDFPGLLAATLYQRVPLRLGGAFEVGPVGVAAGLGPALIVTRTRFDDGAGPAVETTTNLALVYGVRAELPVHQATSGTLLGRVVVDGYRRGRRNDVALMLGLAYRLE